MSVNVKQFLNTNQHSKNQYSGRKLFPLSKFKLDQEIICNNDYDFDPKGDELLFGVVNTCANDCSIETKPKMVMPSTKIQQYYIFNSYNKDFMNYFPKKQTFLLNHSSIINQTNHTRIKSPCNDKPLVLFPSVSSNTIDKSLKHNNAKFDSKQKSILKKNKINLPLFNKRMIKTIGDLDQCSHNENVSNYNTISNTQSNTKVKISINQNKRKLYFPERFHVLNANYLKNRKDITNTYTQISELNAKLSREFSDIRNTFTKMKVTKAD